MRLFKLILGIVGGGAIAAAGVAGCGSKATGTGGGSTTTGTGGGSTTGTGGDGTTATTGTTGPDAGADADAASAPPDGGQDASPPFPTLAQGVTLSNFTGAVYGVESKYNTQLGTGWNRSPQQLTWGSIETSKGHFDWSAGDALVTASHASGVEVLPMLGGVPGWAQSACDAGAGNCGWYPPANLSDWTDFITAFVAHYMAPPFNLRYFEIWNEPGQYGTFWPLDYKSFVDDIFNPAAKIVHQHGGYVVFGGYTCDGCGQPWTVNGTDGYSFDTMLSYNGAWQNTDVLNIHYDPLSDWKSLYTTWVATGKVTGGIWQTEVGWDTNPNRYTAFYLQSMYWALAAGQWAQNPQRYKLIWYAGEGPDPRDLVDTGANALSPTGVQFATMNSALGAGELSAFTTFVSDIQNPAPPKDPISMGFMVGSKRIVIAQIVPDTNAHQVTLHQLPSQPTKITYVDANGKSWPFQQTASGSTDLTVTNLKPGNIPAYLILDW